MKLPANKVNSFVQSIPPDVSACLVYGPNQSLVDWYADKIENTLKSGRFKGADEISMSADEMKEHTGRLANEISNLSLFVPNKIITINNAVDGLTKIITPAIDRLNRDTFLLVKADNLSPKSSLRKLFEGADNLVALACYEETPEQLVQFADAEIARLGLTAPRVVSGLLVQIAGNDRGILAAELNKLSIYIGSENKRITEDDILAVAAETTEFIFDGFNGAVVSGDLATMISNVESGGFGDYQSITIIRGVLWHVLRLMQVRLAMDGGEGFEDASARLKPPLFFKSTNNFKTQVQKNSAGKLALLLEKLLQAEKNLKVSRLPQNPEIIFSNMLL